MLKRDGHASTHASIFGGIITEDLVHRTVGCGII